MQTFCCGALLWEWERKGDQDLVRKSFLLFSEKKLFAILSQCSGGPFYFRDSSSLLFSSCYSCNIFPPDGFLYLLLPIIFFSPIFYIRSLTELTGKEKLLLRNFLVLSIRNLFSSHFLLLKNKEICLTHALVEFRFAAVALYRIIVCVVSVYARDF